MNILMVCLGNICRSPMAEGILKEKIKAKGLSWKVDSAGTSGWHQGELPDRRGRQLLATKGIDIRDQRSRKFQADDFDRFDLILTMDRNNYEDVISIAGIPEHRDKVKMILEFVSDTEEISVPDPYYNDRFEYVYDLLDRACDQIIENYR